MINVDKMTEEEINKMLNEEIYFPTEEEMNEVYEGIQTEIDKDKDLKMYKEDFSTFKVYTTEDVKQFKITIEVMEEQLNVQYATSQRSLNRIEELEKEIQDKDKDIEMSKKIIHNNFEYIELLRNLIDNDVNSKDSDNYPLF